MLVRFRYGFLLVYLIITVQSCRRFLAVPPSKTELELENVFTNEGTALAAISDIYGEMGNQLTFASGGPNAISFFEGVYADELVSSSSGSGNNLSPFYSNNITPTNDIVLSTWRSMYAIIYKANRIIEGLKPEDALAKEFKNQIVGEALFVRAFCHFYLVNLFGPVPLITTSDYRSNAIIARSEYAEIYEHIITDLLEAKNLLSADYPSMGRVRPNRGAATALLARAYLYSNDYAHAELQANEVITQSLYQLENLDAVFLAASREAIWQLLPRGGLDKYTYEGQYFIQYAAPPSLALRSDFIDSFEPGDLRRNRWLDSLVSNSGLTKWYFPSKYKENVTNDNGMEASMVLRLAEQYLIRAECRSHLGKLTGENSAASDIGSIRARSGLDPVTETTFQGVIKAIEQERRIELFTEWGHRFFDLKRNKRLDEVLAAIKPNWQPTDSLLPIPESELLVNKNLKQNEGY